MAGVALPIENETKSLLQRFITVNKLRCIKQEQCNPDSDVFSCHLLMRLKSS